MRPTPLPAELLTPRRRLSTPLTLVVAAAASALLAGAVLTHYLAHRLGYHPALGPPWVVPRLVPWVYAAGVVLAVGLGWVLLQHPRGRPLSPLLSQVAFYFGALALGPIYRPLTGIGWLLPLVGEASTVPLVIEAVAVALAAGVVTFVVTTLPLARSPADARIAAVAHGSSRPATTEDLRRAGLLRGRGVRLGGWRVGGRLRPLADDSEAHVLAVMPTGAGKTTGIILPTLLANLEPAFVLDPKGELWEGSAGWRAKMGHQCLRFSPTAGSAGQTLAWNPFDEIRRGPSEMLDLRILAENLITTPAYLGHNHWTLSAQRLFMLLGLHLLYACRDHPPSLAHLRTLLNHPEKTRYALFKDLLAFPHDPGEGRGWVDFAGRSTPTHPEVALLARSFLNIPERELGSIVSTLQTYLHPWSDPAVAASTSFSDFSLADFARGGEPLTLYVALPYRDLEALAPLLRILLALLIRHLTDDAQRAARNRPRTLFLLDELASLGRLPILEQMLSFFRGYRVRAVLVVQDLGSLVKLYSAAETLSGNCRIHVAAATQSERTREHISRLAGETTVRYRHRSLSGGRGSLFLSKATVSDTTARRALLTPAEVGALPEDRLIVLASGLAPVLAEKLPYYRQRKLARRAAIAPPWFVSGRPETLPPLPPLPSAGGGGRDPETQPVLELEPGGAPAEEGRER